MKNRLENDCEEENEDLELEKVFVLYQGIHVKKNQKRAKQLCFNLAKKGNLMALALKSFYAWEQEEDQVQSFALLREYHDKNKEGIHKGDLYSNKNQLMGYCLFLMGLIKVKGWDGEQNYELGFKYFKEAMEIAENPMVYYELSFLHRFGDGVEKDRKKCVDYLLKSAELGHHFAYVRLGDVYHQEHELIEPDIKMALQYYKKAAEYDEMAALSQLSKIYEEGKDVERDLRLSLDYGLRSYNAREMYDCSFPMWKFDNLFRMIGSRELDWREEYHPFWRTSHAVDDAIVCLLLISKRRKECKSLASTFLVKGVVREIIKFLCNFCQETKVQSFFQFYSSYK